MVSAHTASVCGSALGFMHRHHTSNSGIARGFLMQNASTPKQTRLLEPNRWGMRQGLRVRVASAINEVIILDRAVVLEQ
jgi:hypothetical protein